MNGDETNIEGHSVNVVNIGAKNIESREAIDWQRELILIKQLKIKCEKIEYRDKDDINEGEPRG